MRLQTMIAVAILLPLLGFSIEQPELQTVPRVELTRYLGKWYEIARFPNSFQKDCNDAVAEYSRKDDGKIEVINTCRKSEDGSLKQVTGVAEVVDSQTQAKLKVTFLPGWLRWTGIGKGDYWVVDLANDYSHAVVSEPSRKYLWILSREPVMSAQTYDAILKRLEEKGFNVSSLIFSRNESVRRPG